MSKVYKLQLNEQDFNAHLAAVNSGTNFIKEAKTNSVLFVADCLYRYAENWSKDFLDAATKDIAYFPAAAKIFAAIFEGDNKPLIVHSVKLKPVKDGKGGGFSVKKNQRTKDFSYDKDAIASAFLEAGMAKIEQIHKAKPQAEWDNKTKFIALQKHIKEHADYLEYIINHLDQGDVLRVQAALALKIVAPVEEQKTGTDG